MEIGTATFVEQRSNVPGRGYWRNVYWVPKPIVLKSGCIIGPGEEFGYGKWPSRDVAEQKAQDCLDGADGRFRRLGVRYLGPVFFPG